MSWGIAETAQEIEKIKAESADYLNGLNSCGIIDYSVYSTAFDYYAELIDKAYSLGKSEAKQQWTPCSERLPEEEDLYQVTLDSNNLLDDEKQVTDAYWINNQWQYGVLESYEHRMPKLVIEPIEELKVIAWMPFPESYKGEES